MPRAEDITVFQGSAFSRQLTILDDYGAAVAYGETDVLGATAWPGGNLAAVATLTVAAVTPASGTITLSGTGTDTDVTPGSYPVLLTIEDPDEVVTSYEIARLVVKAAPGTATSPATYCEAQDLIDECPWIEDLLSRQGELAGFLRARGLARKDIDGTIVARYVGDVEYIRAELADDALVVDVDVKRAAALLSLGHVLEHQLGTRDKTSYQQLGAEYRYMGLNLLKGLRVGLITGSGSTPDLFVDLSVLPLRRG